MNPSPEQIQYAVDELISQYGQDSPELQDFLEYLNMPPSQQKQLSETVRDIVPVEQFITDEFYMGGLMASVWPNTVKSVSNVINGGYLEAVFTGGIGTAKTTRATIVCAYNLYVLSCYRNPQEKLGLMKNSDIVFAMLNKTQALASKVTYKRFRKLIENIPYFEKVFKYDKTIESELKFPNNIIVLASNADNDKLLGMDVVAGIVDEINFFQVVEKSKKSRTGGEYDQALEIYNGLVRRIKSRFLGVPAEVRGCMSVVSSRSHKGDFTDQRMKDIEKDRVAGKPVTTYVSNESQWDFMPHNRPDGTVRFGKQRFLVAIGNEKMRSEIITTRRAANGRKVIKVPMEFYDDFAKDMDGSLRDFAGLVSDNSGSYFNVPEIVWDATTQFEGGLWERVFEPEIWDLSNGMPPLNRKWRMYNPRVFRFVHLDLSITGDKCGFAMGHSMNDAPVRVAYDSANYEMERAPKVIFDDMLAIVPPKGGRIQFSHVRQLIYYIKDFLRIPIHYISMDSFQSEDMTQILLTKGFEVVKISVEGEEGYSSLKNAFEESRIVMPVHNHAIGEILHLIQDPVSRRIDHRVGGADFTSKDVSDCLAGINQNMMAHYEAGTLYKRSMLANLYNIDEGISPIHRNR